MQQPPSYRPLQTQQQQAMVQPNGQPLTYEQWLAARGMGQQQQQAPQQAAPQAPGQGILSSVFGGGGGGAGVSQLLGGGSAAGAGGAGEAGISGAGSVANLPAAAGTPGYVYAAPAIAAALGTRWGLRTLQGKGKNWKDASLADNAGRVAAATGTFGLSELGNYAFNKFGKHKSTKERQGDITEELLSQNPDDPVYQNFVQGMRRQFSEGRPESQHKAFGDTHGNEFDTFSDYEKFGLDAKNLTGTEGAIRGGGAEYTHLSPDQQAAYTQALIDAKQFESESGGVGVKDLAAAQKIFQDVKAGGFKSAPTATAPTSKPFNGMATSTQPLRIPQARNEIHDLMYLTGRDGPGIAELAKQPLGQPPVMIPKVPAPYTGRTAAERIAARVGGRR